MGWRGTLRSLRATARAMERASARSHREYQRNLKNWEKEQRIRAAEREVEAFEALIDTLTSVHKDCADRVDWLKIRASPQPVFRLRREREVEARAALYAYAPSLCDRLFGWEASRRRKLEDSIETARLADAEEREQRADEYAEAVESWRDDVELSGNILNCDPAAMLEAIGESEPYADMGDIGVRVEVRIASDGLVSATVQVRPADIIPTREKRLTQAGKLSEKDMPRSRVFELYQDLAVGAALRVARETTALLPIQRMLVHVTTELLNGASGHIEEQPILSVAVPSETLARLNFQSLDPSDSLANFKHRMKFVKTKGFQPIAVLTREELGW
jgi:hypothetical protein